MFFTACAVYCAYEFRQNGAGLLIQDVINILNTEFLFKKITLCVICFKILLIRHYHPHWVVFEGRNPYVTPVSTCCVVVDFKPNLSSVQDKVSGVCVGPKISYGNLYTYLHCT
jgi:hypothetical protein